MKVIRMIRIKTQDGQTVLRLPQDEAATLVASGEWAYATRDEWKAAGRSMK